MPAQPTSWRRRARQLAPWLVAATVVVALLLKYPLDQVALEMQRGNTLAMAPIAFSAAFVALLLVATWDLMVLGPLGTGLRYWDVLRGKAAAALLTTLGYGFGAGAYGLWIGRRTGVGVKATVAVVLCIALCEVAAVGVVASAAFWLGDPALPAAATAWIGIGAPLLPGVVLLLIAVVPLEPWGAGRTPALLRPWATLPRRRLLASVGGRCLNISFFVLTAWGAARAFGLPLPFGIAAVYLPVIFLVGALPVNVAGFGAVQGAWLLFEGYASGASILAFQFLWHLLVTIALIARGLPFVRRVTAEIDQGKARPGAPPRRSGAAH